MMIHCFRAIEGPADREVEHWTDCWLLCPEREPVQSSRSPRMHVERSVTQALWILTAQLQIFLSSEEHLPKHHADAGRTSLYSGFTVQLSCAFLMELRLAKSRRKKKPAELAGNRSTTSGAGSETSSDHIVSSWGSAKPTHR